MTDVPLSDSTVAVASTLCKGFPDTCQIHIQETLDVLRLIPNLLNRVEVIRAAARAKHPEFDVLHQADQTILMAEAMTYLSGAAGEISQDVLP
jgi:hypothetical protein